MTDQEIIQTYLEGGKSAFATVKEWIREVVEARSWESGISPDDIISDTLCKLLLSFRDARFKFESSLKTYVQKVALFTIIDSVRAVRRLRNHLTETHLSSAGSSNPYELMEEREELALFQRIFLLIDEKCRELWLLVFEDKMTYKDIAVRLNISESTVKTRFFRCKEKAVEIRKQIS